VDGTGVATVTLTGLVVGSGTAVAIGGFALGEVTGVGVDSVGAMTVAVGNGLAGIVGIAIVEDGGGVGVETTVSMDESEQAKPISISNITPTIRFRRIDDLKIYKRFKGPLRCFGCDGQGWSHGACRPWSTLHEAGTRRP